MIVVYTNLPNTRHRAVFFLLQVDHACHVPGAKAIVDVHNGNDDPCTGMSDVPAVTTAVYVFAGEAWGFRRGVGKHDADGTKDIVSGRDRDADRVRAQGRNAHVTHVFLAQPLDDLRTDSSPDTIDHGRYVRNFSFLNRLW